MDHTPADLATDVAELRAELARLRSLVEAQGAPPAASAPAIAAEATSGAVAPTSLDGRHAAAQPVYGRRAALKRAGAVAAGAVAGGVAIVGASASPAAAATVTGSGSPGVVGTGLGGDGVSGSTNAASASGVYGATSTADAYGVFARHGTTGQAFGAESSGPVVATAKVTNLDQGPALVAATIGQVAGRFEGGGVHVAANSASAALDVRNQGNGAGVFVQVPSGTGNSFGIYSIADTAAQFDGFLHGVVARSDRAQIRLGGGTSTPPPQRSDLYEVGCLVSTQVDLWYCVEGGAPGKWRKVSGTTTAGAFHVLPAPARTYDSRPGTSPQVGTKAPLVANQARVIDLKANGSGVPAGATAALLTVLLVNAPAGAGNATVWAAGVGKPQANTVVWGPSGGRFTATAVSALDAQARIQVSANLATDVVVDVVGYYR
ncbi:hypothetical protein KSP35_05835 [Aquihabitans sp. G128]|uniref:hypothetical protein n=1 Tax=Aquihabitans sp. G128 TaxID=2849779 RepID=UPI001C23F6FA|nr:hypothetical protein [Aquihabitans sp. G128]QXC62325.1 hypothetical protein KSP35_05835 [Aquihabitans sp. G128]